MKITAQQVIDAAQAKGFRIITGEWRDYIDGEECRCPLNCLLGDANLWFEEEKSIAKLLGVKPEWVNGFMWGVDGCVSSEPIEISLMGTDWEEGYLNGKEVRNDLIARGDSVWSL